MHDIKKVRQKSIISLVNIYKRTNNVFTSMLINVLCSWNKLHLTKLGSLFSLPMMGVSNLVFPPNQNYKHKYLYNASESTSIALFNKRKKEKKKKNQIMKNVPTKPEHILLPSVAYWHV